jgi:hypothetical protein
MEISKFIRNSDHNPDNFYLYPEKIRNKYFNTIRTAIRCGTISGRRYKIVKGMIDEYSGNQEGTLIYNIHPSLFRIIKNRGPSNIYANIFPKRIAKEDNENCYNYSDHVKMWSLPCIKYRKYYIDILLQDGIEDYTIDDSPEYKILEWHLLGFTKSMPIVSIILIMDNIMKRSGIEIILSHMNTTKIGCSYFENKIFCFTYLESYIQLLVRRRRRCIILRLGDKFFNLLVRCFSPFISKNYSRLAMYYV